MKRITYISYKGGSGRTSLLYNTLPFLAKNLGATNERPLIVIDLDLDSKGLSILVKEDDNITNKQSTISSAAILRNDSKLESFNDEPHDALNNNFFKGLIPLGKSLGLGIENNRSVLFISVDDSLIGQKSNYDSGSASLDWLLYICQVCNCCGLVMDAPAGEQLSGQIALECSTDVVLAMRITKQFKIGTAEFIKKIGQRNQGLNVFIVPNAVPKFEGTHYSLTAYMNSIKVECQNNNENLLNLYFDMIDGNNGIEEVNTFKFEEVCLYKKHSDNIPLEDDEQKAYAKYSVLAEALTK